MYINETRPSPNFTKVSSRRITFIVIHYTAGSEASDLSILTDDKKPMATRVSAHYYVTRSGVCYRLVKDVNVAWHAGVSAPATNENSIGIEIENKNDCKQTMTPHQYEIVVALCATLVTQYAIPLSHIVSHASVAIPRGRKSDPACFPWPKFLNDVATRSSNPQKPPDVIGTPPPTPPQKPPDISTRQILHEIARFIRAIIESWGR